MTRYKSFTQWQIEQDNPRLAAEIRNFERQQRTSEIITIVGTVISGAATLVAFASLLALLINYIG